MRDHSRQNRNGGKAAAALTVLLMLAVALLAPSAGAVIVHIAGRTLSYEPGPRSPVRTHDVRAGNRSGAAARPAGKPAKGGGGNGAGGGLAVEYHGGPVMPANTNYTLFWAPGGSSAYPAGFEEGIDGFFEDLAHDSGLLTNTDSILAQYTDGTGHSAAYNSHFGARLQDTDPYPTSGNCTAAPTCLTDAQITAELISYVQAHGLPRGLETEYFVLTPAGVEDCMEVAGQDCSYGTKVHTYCAYHSHVEVSGTPLIYAVDPLIEACQVSKPEKATAYDAVIAGGLVHEHSESLTDPVGKGWYDKQGEEVADKCRTLHTSGSKSEYGPLLGEEEGLPFNEIINGHHYLYQQMWSNSAGECRQRAAELPTITSLSPKIGPAGGGNTVTITGTGFVEPASVSFEGAPGTGVHVSSSTSLTVKAPAGAPHSKVKVTVTTPGGTTPVNKKASYKYKSH